MRDAEDSELHVPEHFSKVATLVSPVHAIQSMQSTLRVHHAHADFCKPVFMLALPCLVVLAAQWHTGPSAAPCWLNPRQVR